MDNSLRTLVTGGSRGIGEALVAEGRVRGHEVTGTTRAMLDVTDPQAQARVAEETGALDLLVCNAGVFLDRGMSLETLTVEALADSFAANVTGVFLTVQAQRPNLSKGARIAIVASQMGSSKQAGGSGFAYRASKAAAINLGLNLATALRPAGIAVGIYHPGWVRTDMGGDSAAVSAEDSARGMWDRFEALNMKRSGRFEDYDGRARPV